MLVSVMLMRFVGFCCVHGVVLFSVLFLVACVLWFFFLIVAFVGCGVF